MRYTIKDRHGNTLYVARSAVDVRAAVQEAARAGADLSGASLSGADLSGADLSGASLSRANLSRASLTGASLYEANLSGASLYGADLSGADLSGADLSGASLSRASLTGASLYEANLSRATGIQAERVSPLHMLRDQVGKIRAYKLVTGEGYGPVKGGIRYEKGKTVSVDNAETNPAITCAAGINVASLDWCMKEWRTGYRILVVEFTAKDIAAIPTATDGKFRLHACKVVGEKDLVALGLVTA
jgi:uncharacterized protein YjbI with pentapeptide repeats